jgi:hypothetical protein
VATVVLVRLVIFQAHVHTTQVVAVAGLVVEMKAQVVLAEVVMLSTV